MRTDKQRPLLAQKIDVEGFLIKVICWSVLIALVIAALKADAVDDWCNDMRNQVKLFIGGWIIAAFFVGKWFIKKLRDL